ncbi:MAG: class I SAM-dependent methyltransferase, partial [bacterium]|nr:class I SAM-dependent methyltransferase [bacterium]
MAKQLRWIIDDIDVNDGLRVQGWALRGETPAADSRFLLNGLPFEEV